MKDTFYYIAGRFSPTNMGFTYTENDVLVMEVIAYDYKDAENKVREECELYYGEQEEKDMWYGTVAYNWKFKQLYKAEFNRYKARANDPDCIEFTYSKMKTSMADYTPPKIDIKLDVNDYPVTETEAIKEFFK